MRPRFVQSTSLIFLLFFPPLEMVVCHRSFFSPSRERPSRTSANYDYLQLEISKGRKRRKEVDSPFPRVFESISKEGYFNPLQNFEKNLSLDLLLSSLELLFIHNFQQRI